MLDNTKTGIYVISEFVSRTSVRQLLDELNRFEEYKVRGYIRQVALGLRYLHRHGIIHRSIKCASLLVTKEDVVKITDFGMSRRLLKLDVSNEEIDEDSRNQINTFC